MGKMGTFANNAGKDYDINLSFVDFRDEEDFFDVTLAAESSDGTIKGLRAHKLILSACSPVLRSLLKEQAKGGHAGVEGQVQAGAEERQGQQGRDIEGGALSISSSDISQEEEEEQCQWRPR